MKKIGWWLKNHKFLIFAVGFGVCVGFGVGFLPFAGVAGTILSSIFFSVGLVGAIGSSINVAARTRKTLRLRKYYRILNKINEETNEIVEKPYINKLSKMQKRLAKNRLIDEELTVDNALKNIKKSAVKQARHSAPERAPNIAIKPIQIDGPLHENQDGKYKDKHNLEKDKPLFDKRFLIECDDEKLRKSFLKKAKDIATTNPYAYVCEISKGPNSGSENIISRIVSPDLSLYEEMKKELFKKLKQTDYPVQVREVSTKHRARIAHENMESLDVLNKKCLSTFGKINKNNTTNVGNESPDSSNEQS